MTGILADVNYSGDPGSDTVRVWDLDTGQELMAFEPGHSRAASRPCDSPSEWSIIDIRQYQSLTCRQLSI